jgi:hypothetical protein
MKVFIGLNNISGYYGPLARGLRELGHEVNEVYKSASVFNYVEGTSNSFFARIYTAFGTCRMKAVKWRLLQKIVFRSLQELLRLPLALWAIHRHDALIFSFGSSIFPGDLLLAKLLKKKTLLIFHGSDSRPPYIDATQFQRFKSDPVKGVARCSRQYAKRIRRFEEQASFLITLPSSSQFFSKPAISYLAFGVPCLPEKLKEDDCNQGGPVRILHTPTNREVKGSDYIIKVIEELKLEGLNIDLRVLSNVSNCVVRHELRICDLVVDQAYSDTPLASFACEAATFGRPVLVCGFFQEETASFHKSVPLPPSCYCDPRNLKAELKALILSAERRIKLGLALRAFVRERWNYREVAKRCVTIFSGDIPPGWFFNPLELRRAAVIGPIQLQFERLKRIYDYGGKEALCLGHNPELERNFVNFLETGVILPEVTLSPRF